jgi:glycosyltransferase involved in cell wall biosynthesis
MPSVPRKLSVLVVAFQEARHLGGLLRAVDRLRRPAGVAIEVVVVDGGSTDGTVAVARGGGARVVMRPGANIPACRNAALAASDGEWVAFLDADCEPAEDWLEAALPFLEQAGPLALGWPVEPPLPGTWVQRAWHTHWSFKNPRREEWQGRSVVRHEAFRLLTTRNLLFHRALADELGGFDEALPTGEDTDFVFRADRRGHTVLAVPALRVLHHGEPETLAAFFRQQLWHANRSSYRKIVRESGGRVGGNAPRFTALFLAATGLALVAAPLAVGLDSPLPWLGLLPLPTLIALPALRTALRAHRPAEAPALAVLYAAYGLARSLDLLGFGRHKRSWKAAN